jgi:peptide/nickel transport system permease protein
MNPEIADPGMDALADPDMAEAGLPAALPGVRASSLVRRALLLWRTRIGVGLVSLLVLLAIIGPYVAPYGPSTFVAAPNSTPGGHAALGTDYLGQDVLSRLLYGGRSILVMAVLATVW